MEALESLDSLLVDGLKVPVRRSRALVVGSGAAGLNAAARLRANGIEDTLILTEGLRMGTSINTGSDKQTYYKLGMYGRNQDSVESLAESFFAGGAMHGDLAVVEAAGSAMAFLNLVNLGVPFPRDAYGQFVGYKTDHDPSQRATSVGPYTSREMCLRLIEDVRRRGIEVVEGRMAADLLTIDDEGGRRACGVVAMRLEGGADAIEVYLADNVVFAVGGPGGLYASSVYPSVHTGAIGLALLAGAKARNLPESQYGMASVKFRWNVSGTYMQVVPRFVSTAADGGDEREFLRPYFASAGAMDSAIFLKGYQWPFDPRKVLDGGSSLIDILVHIETVEKGRKVFLDYRRNGDGFSFDGLSAEARSYLEKSGALLPTPIERLAKMNQPALDLYADHGIDITREPLQIAVCAQHNNGGLAGNIWWESENIRRLFPVGEANGSHGVYRPGGSALNSGQVGAFRAAEFIANAPSDGKLDLAAAAESARSAIRGIRGQLAHGRASGRDWREHRFELQSRMSRAAAHVRSEAGLRRAVDEAWRQWREIRGGGCGFETDAEAAEAARNSQLCFAHAVYLEAALANLAGGVGSRGSYLAVSPDGAPAHPELGDEWRFEPENPEFRAKILETSASPDGRVENVWSECRPMPESDAWFENAWAAFRQGEIYRHPNPA